MSDSETKFSRDLFAGKTMLIVDDEESVRLFLERALKTFGCIVQSASNGEDALARFNENKNGFDAVVLDLGMPGMSGQTVMTKLREIRPEIKIILSSGQNSADLEQYSDATTFIPKPYKLNDLLCTLSSVLGSA